MLINHFYVIVYITQIKFHMAAGRHLENMDMIANDRPITTKFGRQMQNGMPILYIN